jgi:hypothetical protein
MGNAEHCSAADGCLLHSVRVQKPRAPGYSVTLQGAYSEYASVTSAAVFASLQAHYVLLFDCLVYILALSCLHNVRARFTYCVIGYPVTHAVLDQRVDHGLQPLKLPSSQPNLYMLTMTVTDSSTAATHHSEQSRKFGPGPIEMHPAACKPLGSGCEQQTTSKCMRHRIMIS